MSPQNSEEIIQELLGAAAGTASGSTVSTVSTGSPGSTGAQEDLAPKVLIVEDDPDIACALTMRLQIQGLQTCVAHDAESALTIALEHEPVCAILDMNVPGGDGFSVAQELRSKLRTPGIPIVFLTASMRPGLKEKVEAIEGATFVSKPYDAAKLMLTVQELVDGACRRVD